MHYLALDVGTRRTGVAFADDANGIALPLDTIKHTSLQELLEAVRALISERDIDRVIVGLPLLLSGTDGAQAAYVRTFSDLLTQVGIAHALCDERYTTPPSSESDGDAAAACALLLTALQRLPKRH